MGRTMVQKKKLGEKALDWITDTAEGEEVLSEQAESSKNKSAGKSKEKKIEFTGPIGPFLSGNQNIKLKAILRKKLFISC